MGALQMMITDAGLAAIVDAQAGGTEQVLIAEIGLSDTPFVMAPTLTALPGEFRRLDTVSGQAVAENIIHVVAYDPAAITYDVTGFGLFDAEGTLIAVHSAAADPILSKAELATSLFALDIQLAGEIADVIEFGDALFLNPPATETVAGVARIATNALADAGLDDLTIMSPKKAKRVIDAAKLVLNDAIAAVSAALGALVDRTITGGGLATGGGSLAANRVITVTRASAAEVSAGADDDKAITPLALATSLAARTITGAGLITGGGDMTASRVLTLTKASGAEVTAGVDDAKAITPLALATAMGARSLGVPGYISLFGFIIQWGTYSAPANGTASPSFPVTFPTACVHADVNGGRDDTAAQDNNPHVNGKTASGFSIFNATDTGPITGSWFAIGY